LLLLIIINAPKSKEYNKALLYYAAGILAVIIGGWSYVKISVLLNWPI
jgi:preprotein translocase subunit Sss1